MSKLTITAAIDHSPVGRTQFYKEYINTGKITVSVDERGKKYIESSELLRVFGKLSTDIREQKKVNPAVQETVSAPEQSELVRSLREQLSELRSESTKREEWYQSQIVSLTNRLEAPIEKPAVQHRPNPLVRWWRGLDS